MFVTRLNFTVLLLVILCLPSAAQVMQKKGSAPQRIYGLTIEELDKLDVSKFESKFRDVRVPITLRVVFQANSLPSDYEDKLEALYNLKDRRTGKRRFYILALPFDSYALKSYKLGENIDPNFNCETLKSEDIEKKDVMNYNQRAKCFVEHFKGAKDYIDAWEVGNEVNGEWADERFNEETKKNAAFVGDYKATVKKIKTLVDLIPNSKPLALTISYMPNCNDWNDNAMDVWINHFTEPELNFPVDRIDYVLISYYENNCHFHVLETPEINDSIFGRKLRKVFTNQFVGIGEIGYSDGDDEEFQTCRHDDTCYCAKTAEACEENFYTARRERRAFCPKSKISQMQRYYGMKPTDPLYIGGGFWWNAGRDYKIDKFVAALKNEFGCLSAIAPCEQRLPVNCP